MSSPRIESAIRSTSYSVSVTPPLNPDGPWIVRCLRNRWWPNGGQESVAIYSNYVLHSGLEDALVAAIAEIPGVLPPSEDPLF